MTSLPPTSPQFGSQQPPSGAPDPRGQQDAHAGPPPPGHDTRLHPGNGQPGPAARTSAARRAPALLPIAIASGIFVAVPLVVFLVTVDSLLDTGEASWATIGTIAAVVGCLSPVAGIIAGIHAGATRRAPVSIGGWLLVVGSVLQIVYVVVMTILLGAELIHSFWIAATIHLAATIVPAIINLVAGILGLQRPRS